MTRNDVMTGLSLMKVLGALGVVVIFSLRLWQTRMRERTHDNYMVVYFMWGVLLVAFGNMLADTWWMLRWRSPWPNFFTIHAQWAIFIPVLLTATGYFLHQYSVGKKYIGDYFLWFYVAAYIAAFAVGAWVI